MATQTAELVRVVDGALVPAPGTWEFDVGHSEISFEGRHLAARVRGRFLKFSGRLIVAESPNDSVAELEIDATSLFSGFKDRDHHLRSADWFAVDEHPTIAFRSRSGRHVGWNRWRDVGDGLDHRIQELIGSSQLKVSPSVEMKCSARPYHDSSRSMTPRTIAISFRTFSSLNQ